MANGNATPKPELLWYILSYFISTLGIIFAIVYMSKPEPEAKVFGRNCLIIALISLLMSAIGCVIIILVGGFIAYIS
ncbi:MAG: hypothetical protein PVH29_04140 [Candidatus Zixiibacteriota bacterium]